MTKITKSRIIFTLFLMFAIAIPLANLPTVNSHTPPWTIPTVAFLNVSPSPIGVGQTAYVNMFLDKAVLTANAQFGDRWHNFTLSVTDPDGVTKILGPFTSDDAGGAWTQYTPEKIGNYTFVFNFPGQTLLGANPHPRTGTTNPQYVGDYFQPSTSEKVVLSVQQEPIGYLPENPLPLSYWERPINAMNTAWYSISGNWFGIDIDQTGGYSQGGTYDKSSQFEGNFNPYTTAPSAAHIVWTKPYAAGGLMGGEYGSSKEDSMFYAAAQYETKFSPIIMNGVIYYNSVPGSINNRQGWVAIDLNTGETLWTKDTKANLITGQILNYVSPNQYGGIPYLWTVEPTVAPNTGTTYGMYDAWTGNWILNIVNGTRDTAVGMFSMDERGSLLGYYINSTDWTINMWNSTKAIMDYNSIPNSWQWRPPQGANISFSYGKQFSQPFAINITKPDGTKININQAIANISGTTPQINALHIQHVTSNVIVVTNIDYARWDNFGWSIMEGYDAKTGELLWGPLNYTFPTMFRMWPAGASAEDDVFTFAVNEENAWYGYKLSTGEKIWGPVKVPHNAWSYYQYHGIIAYGNLYTADLGGYVNCLDAKTGTLKWTWNTGSSGWETPYGIWPIVNFEAIADGKLYFVGGHMYSPPMYHGAQRYCINATSGEPIWSISSFGIANHAKVGVADGYLIVPNAYDNQIYAYGKGPTKTTVAAPSVGVTTSTPITISGSITDVSAGSKQNAIAENFPNGLPCVSDASMSAFMEAVYMQQPLPTNLTGVPVTINVVDSNGNYRTIGTAVSNAYGTYSLTWTPDISGDYTIIATFAGTQSYYPSEAAGAFYASEAAATPAPTPATASMADQYFLPVSIAIIIAIVIVGVVLSLLMLRKRP